jgi:hypothetical protein
MQEPVCHENYPTGTVIASNLVSFLIYSICACILYMVSIILVVFYLLFIILLEFRLLSRHCTDCYYYGKCCAFGKGRISSLFFPRGRPDQFSQKKITWRDIVPDFLVFIIPVLAGVMLLFQGFTWIVFFLVVSLLFLGFFGNAMVRGHLACRYCKQREIGCPAERLFATTKNT